MTKAKDGGSGRTDGCGCCSVDIHIEAKGDVNVYACSPAGKGGDDRPGGGPAPECPPRSCDPIAPGQCLPLTLGAKPKQSARRKLDTILASSKVPSVLAAGFFRHAGRYLAGEAPANPLETQAFALFRAMPADLQALLRCADASVKGLPAGDRDRLLDPGIFGGSGPLDAVTLATALGVEIGRRGRDAQFDDPDAVERPGRNRFYDVAPGEENFDFQLRICSVDDLRTVNFKPPLTAGDYLPTEIQQSCTPVVVNGETQLSCQIQTGNCPGQSLSDGSCLRVPDVEAGAAVVLKGVNFISTDAKVRLEARPPLSLVREVEAFVFGDLDTPLSEVVDGQVVTIRDCRVHDQITFKVPDDLPSGVYGIQVVEPNVSGFPNLGDPLISNQEFIAVVPPAGALFTIASEELVAREETSPAPFGSDEVRVRTRAYPLTLSTTGLVLGDEQAFDSPEFGDMDSGERRAMAAVLFANTGPIDGVVLSVMGFEIDSESAYRDQINSFSDAFWHYLKIAAGAVFAAGAAGALALGLKDLLLLALAHPILLAIAAALVLAVVIFVAAWAPADPIIVDAIGLTRLDLAALTNANLPLPPASTAITQEDIKVNISPLEKLPNQYRERREYVSSEEDSRYEIVLRYNRVA
jgi:hypothetical protein